MTRPVGPVGELEADGVTWKLGFTLGSALSPIRLTVDGTHFALHAFLKPAEARSIGEWLLAMASRLELEESS